MNILSPVSNLLIRNAGVPNQLWAYKDSEKCRRSRSED